MDRRSEKFVDWSLFDAEDYMRWLEGIMNACTCSDKVCCLEHSAFAVLD
jgi:hypothetical protein